MKTREELQSQADAMDAAPSISIASLLQQAKDRVNAQVNEVATVYAGDERERSINLAATCVGQIAFYELEAIERLLKATDSELVTVLKKCLHAFKVLGIEPADSNYWSIVEQAEIAIAKAEARS